MSAKWLIGPRGEKVPFNEGPSWFEDRGIAPSYLIEAILREHGDGTGSFFVRPSDVSPTFTCRRQRVWTTNHDYGVDPLAAEAMIEGSAIHEQLKTQELKVPFVQTIDGRAYRLEVCGVPLRGVIDWLRDDLIVDLKSSTPFWVPRFPSKEAKLADPSLRPYAEIWLPKDDSDDVLNWNIQLSIYRVLLEKEGRTANVPTKGRVWKRWSGVKADKGKRWTRYDFDLMDEAELEAKVGPWMRGLWEGLQAVESDPEAWKGVPADGRQFVGSRGNFWACDRCPLREICFQQDGLEVF